MDNNLQANKQRMSSNTDQSKGVTIVKLTTMNLELWKENLKRNLLPMGQEASIIILKHKLPVPEWPVPTLDDYRLDHEGNKMLDYPKYKTFVKDSNGLVLWEDGKQKFTIEPSAFIAFDKATNDRRLEVVRLSVIIAKVAGVIASSISEQSISLMKTTNLTKYTEALGNPAEMLALIDITHQLNDNSNKIMLMNKLINCKQEDFNGDYMCWVADFFINLRNYSLKNNTAKDECCRKAVQEVIDDMARSLIMLNCNKNQFKFILDLINTTSDTISFKEVTDKMTAYVKNTPVDNNISLVARNPNKPKVKNQETVSGATTKCSICGRSFLESCNFKTGIKHPNCFDCHTKLRKESKLNSNNKGPEEKTGITIAESVNPTQSRQQYSGEIVNGKPQISRNKTSRDKANALVLLSNQGEETEDPYEE